MDKDGNNGRYSAIYTGNGLNKDGTVNCTNGEGLRVTKIWKDADNKVMADPPLDKISFKLEGKKGNDWVVIKKSSDTQNWTITKDDSWAVTIPNELLEGYTDFRVTEDTSSIPYGYSVNYNKNLSGAGGQITITNKNPYAASIDLEVTKVWSDGLTAHDEVKFNIYKSKTVWASSEGTAEEIAASELIKEGVVLNEANGWSYTLSGLENVQDSGDRYNYYAVEQVPSGYVASYERVAGSKSTSVTVTNSPKPTPQTLKVNKVWDKVVSSKKPVELELYRKLRPLTTERYKIPNNVTVAANGNIDRIIALAENL